MDSNSYSNNLNSHNELDPEAQHLAFLTRQIVPSPMQPLHHDNSANFSASSPAPKPNNERPSATTSENVQSKSNFGPASATAELPPATPTSNLMSAGMFSVGPNGPMTPRTPMSADPSIVPQLQNIVSTVNLGCKLDLKKIALHARNAEYNPKRFAAVIMRIREPRTTALIFSSGKMVCTGAKSEEMSRLAARKYARIVQKLGFEVYFVIILIIFYILILI